MPYFDAEGCSSDEIATVEEATRLAAQRLNISSDSDRSDLAFAVLWVARSGQGRLDDGKLDAVALAAGAAELKRTDSGILRQSVANG